MGGKSAAARRASMLWLVPAALGLVGAAQAQSGACDSLKQKLAARIEAGGVRGYGLEIAPASVPLPSGAKVIGTCDGGAFRLVYRRFAEAREAAALPAVEPAPKARKSEVAAPATVTALPATKPRPVEEPAAANKPVQAAVVSVPASRAPATVESAPAPAAPTPGPAVPTPEPALHVAAKAGASAVPLVQTTPEPVFPAAETSAEAPSAQDPSWAQRASAFWAAHWAWICAALLVPLAALLWAWYAHNRDYDEAGLPRGPRL